MCTMRALGCAPARLAMRQREAHDFRVSSYEFLLLVDHEARSGPKDARYFQRSINARGAMYIIYCIVVYEMADDSVVGDVWKIKINIK